MVEVYVWELPPSCSECFACRYNEYGDDECGISGELIEDDYNPFGGCNFSWHDKWDKRRPDCPLKLKERDSKMSDVERLKAIADGLDKVIADFKTKAIPLFIEASEKIKRVNEDCGGIFAKLGEISEEEGVKNE